jgi:virulence-associated protein VagC
MNIDALPTYFTQIFRTNRVRIYVDGKAMTIEPIDEPVEKKRSSADKLCGLLADCSEMSVDKFLERKHTDQELDL